MITVSFGRPRISTHKAGTAQSTEELNVVEKAEAFFSSRNLIVLGTGIALGIILKQQSDIHTLKRTVEYLQEVIR